LSLLALCLGILKAKFWADDFENFATYWHSLGNLRDLTLNLGRYFQNFYWFATTYAFGNAPAAIYVSVNLIFILVGVYFLSRVVLNLGFVSVNSLSWVWALSLSTSTFYQLILWPSNSCHCFCFMVLSFGLYSASNAWTANQLAKTANSWNLTICMIVVACTNPLYAIVYPLSLVFIALEIKEVRLGTSKYDPKLILSWVTRCFFVPAFYHFILLRALNLNKSYSHPSINYIFINIRFYIETIFGNGWLSYFAYAATFLVLLLNFFFLKKKSWIPLLLLILSEGIIFEFLVQRNIRVLNYLFFPLSIILILMVSMVRDFRLSFHNIYLKKVYVLSMFLLGFLIVTSTFQSTASIRDWWLNYSAGQQLDRFRTHLVQVTTGFDKICFGFAGDASLESDFVGANGGSLGFIKGSFSFQSVKFETHTCKIAPDEIGIDVRRSSADMFSIGGVKP
jgi:hypothetical protein